MPDETFEALKADAEQLSNLVDPRGFEPLTS
jgi:hypothetical protein